MKVHSKKAKGRGLQKWVQHLICDNFNLSTEDVRSTAMGQAGEDIQFSTAARDKFPFSIECKAVEKLNLYDAYRQAQENCHGYEPIVIHKRNRNKPLVTLDAKAFIRLMTKVNFLNED